MFKRDEGGPLSYPIQQKHVWRFFASYLRDGPMRRFRFPDMGFLPAAAEPSLHCNIISEKISHLNTQNNPPYKYLSILYYT